MGIVGFTEEKFDVGVIGLGRFGKGSRGSCSA